MTDAPRLGICLVGGTGRSGTTLIRDIFSRHPQVATFPTETRILVDPDGLIDFYDTAVAGWSPYVYDTRVRRLRGLLERAGSAEFARGRGRPRRDQQESTSFQRGAASVIQIIRETVKASPLLPAYFNVDLRKSVPDFDELAEKLIRDLSEFSFSGRWTGIPRFTPSVMVVGPRADVNIEDVLGDFYRSLLRSAAGRTRTHVVEDTPFNHLSFNRILKLLPEAKLVEIHRDPRDVVASMATMVWAPTDPAQAAVLYARIMDEWQRIKTIIPRDSFLEVQLEKLVDDPEDVLKAICAHWQLPWDARLLEIDLAHSHIGRWRDDFSPAAAHQIEPILRPYVEELGYSVDN